MSNGAVISTLDRERTLQALESERFDLVVIGGGITGAGLARRATLSGLAARRYRCCIPSHECA